MAVNSATRRQQICPKCGRTFTTWRAFTGHAAASHDPENVSDVLEDMIEGVPAALDLEEAQYIIEHAEEFGTRAYAAAHDTLAGAPK